MGPSPSPAWIPFPTAVYRAAAPRRSRPPPIRAVPGALPPSLRPIRSLRKDPVHGSFECLPTPVPHDRLRLPPPSSFGLALHRRSPPSEPWVSLAALQSPLRAPTLPPLASLAVLPVGVGVPTWPRRLASSRTGRRRRPSTLPLAAEARLPARALLLLALPRPDSCRSSPPAVLARRSPSIPADVAHAMRCRQRRRAGRPSPFADTYAMHSRAIGTERWPPRHAIGRRSSLVRMSPILASRSSSPLVRLWIRGPRRDSSYRLCR
ncbi:atherin-like isoform X2 [Panicum virgatum]|uniref:atherin-like isoform X2 n=1 Tax=Panicum virgatum TaxID=38727 RepID=UPI0019D5563A|nr:atherin-like isoform X2 [Panicum virgatum]